MLNNITINRLEMRTRLAFLLSFFGFILTPTSNLAAQTIPAGAELEATILEMDSVFWLAYNTCDVEKMMSYVGENVEFYHDKGGIINKRVDLAKAMNEGLCRSGANEIERRPVAGTIEVFPIAGIGAILRGQHTFHGIKNPGDDGIAYFFHYWKYTAGDWKMTRIFSYDHAPLPVNPDVQAIDLTTAELSKFVGTYQAPQSGTITIQTAEDGLVLLSNDSPMPLLAKSPLVFFNRQMPLEFKFTLDGQGAILKFSVYENGVMVEEALRKR